MKIHKQLSPGLKVRLDERHKAEKEAISGRLKEFINMQKEYHATYYQVGYLSAEFTEYLNQVKAYDKNADEPTIKWNGIPIPINILKAKTGTHNIKYVEAIGNLEYLNKALLAQGLNEKQVKEIGIHGTYIKEQINTGEETPKINKGQ